MADRIIHNQTEHRAMIEARRKKSDLRQVRTETVKQYSHAEVASQAIKVINSLPMDSFVKKVMTLRVIGPLLTGHERTHISIALELGATIDDIIQAEEYGIDFVNEAMAKCALPDFIGKFNADKKVESSVRGMIDG